MSCGLWVAYWQLRHCDVTFHEDCTTVSNNWVILVNIKEIQLLIRRKRIIMITVIINRLLYIVIRWLLWNVDFNKPSIKHLGTDVTHTVGNMSHLAPKPDLLHLGMRSLYPGRDTSYYEWRKSEHLNENTTTNSHVYLYYSIFPH